MLNRRQSRDEKVIKFNGWQSPCVTVTVNRSLHILTCPLPRSREGRERTIPADRAPPI